MLYFFGRLLGEILNDHFLDTVPKPNQPFPSPNLNVLTRPKINSLGDSLLPSVQSVGAGVGRRLCVWFESIIAFLIVATSAVMGNNCGKKITTNHYYYHCSKTL